MQVEIEIVDQQKAAVIKAIQEATVGPWNTVLNFMAAAIKAIQEAFSILWPLPSRPYKSQEATGGPWNTWNGIPYSIFNFMAAAIKAIPDASGGGPFEKTTLGQKF